MDDNMGLDIGKVCNRSMRLQDARIGETQDSADNALLTSLTILESLGDGISIQDRNLKILYQNQKQIEFLGDHIGEYCYHAYEQREVACGDECPVLTTFQMGQPAMAVKKATTPEGIQHFEIHTTPIRNGNNEIIFVIECVRNITERNRIEEDRLANLLFSESLIKNSPLGIRVFDGESGDCILLNRAAVQITGGDADTMQRQNYREILSWRESGLLGIAEKVLADGEVRKGDVDLCTSFNKKVSVTYIFSRFISSGKQYLSVFGRDITEEKKAAENCKKLEDKMFKLQKIETLGTLAGGIAHDFNNILTAIIGNADLALMRLAPESPVIANLNAINTSAYRASELARQMLAYAGRGRLVVEQLDINDLIFEMIPILEVSISKKVTIRFVPSENIQQLSVDATQIRQIVMNLVINASEAIGDTSGTITITTGAVDCDRNFLSDISLDEELEAGRYVYFEVSDTGSGMDNETLSKLFDPFFTTKFLGRGLGMSAVMGIIRRHKGAIEIHSKQGEGSCFKVLLPASGNCSVAPTRESCLVVPAKGSGTILLVDDEENICSIGREILQKLGYAVLTAQNGEEALEQYRLHEHRINLVILDVTMPKMDGEETLMELKKINNNVKVILSSGYSEHEINEKFKDKGVVCFIQKPYRLDNFVKTIQMLSDDNCKTCNC